MKHTSAFKVGSYFLRCHPPVHNASTLNNENGREKVQLHRLHDLLFIVAVKIQLNIDGVDCCCPSIMIFTTQSSTLHCLEPELQNCICTSYKNLFYLLKCSGCLKTMISRIRTGMLCRLVKRRCTRLGTIVCHKLSDLSFVKRGPDAKFIPLPLFSGLSL